MKSLLVFALCSIGFLAGCDSMSSRVRDRFTPVAPQTRVFAANRRAVFNAALTAVKNIELLVGRKSLAQGVIEAYAPIREGDAIHDTRQTTLKITLTETDDGQTQVGLLVSDSTEGSFPGGVSEQDLREHSLYGLYFAALQQVLLENGSIKPAPNP
ncbi:MAG: hypothetical protein ABI273_14055 [Lacunisphaera sp.]